MSVKARFMRPESGWPCDQEKARKAGLTPGTDYDLERVSMGQSTTTICLAGYSGVFNSVQFDFFEDGEPLDIYRDPRFNPYLGISWRRA